MREKLKVILSRVQGSIPPDGRAVLGIRIARNSQTSAGCASGWPGHVGGVNKMLSPIERGRLNEQVLIAPVLRTPAPSWPPGINRCGKQRGQYRGQILSAKPMERHR